jgi:hypothetical protein
MTVRRAATRDEPLICLQFYYRLNDIAIGKIKLFSLLTPGQVGINRLNRIVTVNIIYSGESSV